MYPKIPLCNLLVMCIEKLMSPRPLMKGIASVVHTTWLQCSRKNVAVVTIERPKLQK
jgi:hypothetical protein